MFLLNSRLGRFAATPACSGGKPLHTPKHPFSRSYGANLPNSLTWFLSRTSGFSPCPPVSVCGTGPPSSTLRSFSRQHGVSRSALSVDAASRHASGFMTDGFSCRSPYTLGLCIPSHSRPSLLRHSIAPTAEYRNINLLSIDYAFRPRLRSRLTLGGRTFPRKPWTFGGRDSHPPCRYSYLHSHLSAVQHPSRHAFNPQTTLSYRALQSRTPAASVPGLVPIIFGAESLDR